jgi:dTDP-4-dehydrorhamnose reductase
MNIVVLGDGLLGSEIVKQTNWDYLSRKKDGMDIRDITSYQDKMYNYDVIVNCIAYTKTYENNKQDNWNINVKSLHSLIEFCNNHNKKLIHISTDYIYTGSIENATENDVPIHINTWYGYSKLVGDALVQLLSNNYLICRLSHKPYPFPYEEAWIDIKTNCDYVTVIADLVVRLIKNESIGVFNVGTEVKSIYDMAKSTKKDVKSSNKPEIAPSDTSMNINKLKSELGI